MIVLNKITHNKITPEILERICNIKTIAQPYSIEDLKKWIQSNLNQNDIHIILTQDNVDLAYLNIVKVEVKINGESKQIYGIGNVCAIERGKGFGRQIMELTNEYLTKKNKIGLLFCIKGLVRFYSSLQWIVLNDSLVHINTTRQDVITMIFNCQTDIKSIEYNSKLF